MTTTRNSITEKQLAFIEKLKEEKKGATALVLQGLRHRNMTDLRDVSTKDASALIKRLLNLPPKKNAQASFNFVPLEDGIYKKGDNIYKVLTSPETGRQYARRAEVYTVDDRNKIDWQYAKGALRELSSADKLKKEDAQKFGSLYHICVRCGRVLTAEDSIERKMGPVCFEKMGY